MDILNVRGTKMRLGFDLDEVVVDLSAQFEKYLEMNYGIAWPPECFVQYSISRCVFNKEDEELNSRVIKDLQQVANDAEFQFQAKPMYDSRRVLQKLRRAGHKLYFITSRPKQNQPATFKWLRYNDIPFDGLRVIGHSEPKGLYGVRCKLDMYVDDLESHLESMWAYKKRWRKGLLLYDRPWNYRKMDGSKFIRIFGWEEILRHVGVQNR